MLGTWLLLSPSPRGLSQEEEEEGGSLGGSRGRLNPPPPSPSGRYGRGRKAGEGGDGGRKRHPGLRGRAGLNPGTLFIRRRGFFFFLYVGNLKKVSLSYAPNNGVNV